MKDYKRCNKCKYEDNEEGITIYYPSDWDNGIGFGHGTAIFCPECGRPLTSLAKKIFERRIKKNNM